MAISTGRPPSIEQEKIINATADHWRKIGNEAPVQAVTRVEDAAKQLIKLTGTLQGLYFTVVTFSSLQQRVKGWNGGALLLLLPVLFWLLSMLCATLVFIPRVRDVDLNNSS